MGTKLPRSICRVSEKRQSCGQPFFCFWTFLTVVACRKFNYFFIFCHAEQQHTLGPCEGNAPLAEAPAARHPLAPLEAHRESPRPCRRGRNTGAQGVMARLAPTTAPRVAGTSAARGILHDAREPQAAGGYRGAGERAGLVIARAAPRVRGSTIPPPTTHARARPASFAPIPPFRALPPRTPRPSPLPPPAVVVGEPHPPDARLVGAAPRQEEGRGARPRTAEPRMRRAAAARAPRAPRAWRAHEQEPPRAARVIVGDARVGRLAQAAPRADAGAMRPVIAALAGDARVC